MNSGEMTAAFALYPTSMEDLMAVAEAEGHADEVHLVRAQAGGRDGLARARSRVEGRGRRPRSSAATVLEDEVHPGKMVTVTIFRRRAAGGCPSPRRRALPLRELGVDAQLLRAGEAGVAPFLRMKSITLAPSSGGFLMNCSWTASWVASTRDTPSGRAAMRTMWHSIRAGRGWGSPQKRAKAPPSGAGCSRGFGAAGGL